MTAALNHRLLDPAFSHEREYWVQVEGAIGPAALHQLERRADHRRWPDLSDQALQGRADHLAPGAGRDPPIRYRAQIPTSWVRLVLTEGKNRQVRKMTAQTGFPTLRLIRYRIEGVTLDGYGARGNAVIDGEGHRCIAVCQKESLTFRCKRAEGPLAEQTKKLRHYAQIDDRLWAR
jgi:pseudouridine synthase